MKSQDLIKCLIAFAQTKLDQISSDFSSLPMIWKSVSAKKQNPWKKIEECFKWFFREEEREVAENCVY